jgi:hypothetical protein
VAAAVAAFRASFADTALASETVSSVPNYAARVSEAAQAQDFDAVVGVVFTPFVAESAVGQDTTSSIFIIPADLTESAAAQDTPSANAAFPTQLSEAAALADTARSNPNFQASVAETVLALDAIRTAQTFAVSISESAFGLDTLLGRELWEDIDDTQVAGWTDILVPTTIDSIAVFGDANFGALSFAGNAAQRYDPNPVIWNEVDDTQDPGWTDIVAV